MTITEWGLLIGAALCLVLSILNATTSQNFALGIALAVVYAFVLLIISFLVPSTHWLPRLISGLAVLAAVAIGLINQDISARKIVASLLTGVLVLIGLTNNEFGRTARQLLDFKDKGPFGIKNIFASWEARILGPVFLLCGLIIILAGLGGLVRTMAGITAELASSLIDRASGRTPRHAAVTNSQRRSNDRTWKPPLHRASDTDWSKAAKLLFFFFYFVFAVGLEAFFAWEWWSALH